MGALPLPPKSRQYNSTALAVFAAERGMNIAEFVPEFVSLFVSNSI